MTHPEDRLIPPLESERNQIFQVLPDIIRENSIDEYRRLIERFPFDRMNLWRFEYVFTQLINFIALYGTQEAFRITIEIFKANNPGEVQEGHLRMIDRVWVYRQVNDAARGMLVAVYPEEKYSDYLDQLIATDGSVEVLEACHRLERVYGAQPLRTYLDGVDKLDQQGQIDGFCNLRVLEFLKDRIRHRRNVAPRPDHMLESTLSPISWTDLVDLNYSARVDLTPPDPTELNEFLTFMDIFDDATVAAAVAISDPKIKTYAAEAQCDELPLLDRAGLAAAWERMLPTQRQANLKGKSTQEVDPTVDDVIIYRILGPVNISPASAVPARCVKYGGCRMQTCVCFADQSDPTEDEADEADEADDYEIDWFTGRCDHTACGQIIKHRHRAVRSPNLSILPGTEYDRYQGSWVGCYCKWQCVTNDLVIQPYTDKKPKDVPYEEIDPLTRIRIRLIQFYSAQMMDLGLYDLRGAELFPTEIEDT